MPKRNRLRGNQRALLLNDLCVYCYNAPEQIDHINPIARGGTNGWLNSAPVCNECNTRKADMNAVEFLLYLQYYNEFRKHYGSKKASRLTRKKLNGKKNLL